MDMRRSAGHRSCPDPFATRRTIHSVADPGRGTALARQHPLYIRSGSGAISKQPGLAGRRCGPPRRTIAAGLAWCRWRGDRSGARSPRPAYGSLPSRPIGRAHEGLLLALRSATASRRLAPKPHAAGSGRQLDEPHAASPAKLEVPGKSARAAGSPCPPVSKSFVHYARAACPRAAGSWRYM